MKFADNEKNMQIKFEGSPMSAWGNFPEYAATSDLPEVFAFFPFKCEYDPSLTYGDEEKKFSFKKEDGALCFCESDKNIISLNEKEENLTLSYTLRLIDTRNGLVLLIMWCVGEDTPQATSTEHFLNMHNKSVTALLRGIACQDAMPLLYCDMNSKEVVRSAVFPNPEGELFGQFSRVADAADKMLDSQGTHSREIDLPKAIAEAQDYVDKHPPQSLMILLPAEKTYE